MKPHQDGYALIVILLMAALLLISLSIAVPRVLTQGQREKEEELLFRGGQYRRAIGLYYKKFGRYPMTMEDLRETNERAFLRREYPDPMTPEGKWRLIHLGPGGALIGSVHELAPLGQASESPSPSPGQEQESSQGRAASGSEVTSSPDTIGGQSTYPIAGVASQSTARSIKIYEGYSYYYQWEFIYDPAKEALGNRPPVPGTPQPETGSSSESPDSPP